MDTQLHPFVSELVDQLRKVLDNPYAQAANLRAPNKLDSQLKKSCAQRPEDVWLCAGFQAWFAYTYTYPVVDVSKLPQSVLEQAASLLCNITPHSTIQDLFQHVLYGAERSRDRRCKCQVIYEPIRPRLIPTSLDGQEEIYLPVTTCCSLFT